MSDQSLPHKTNFIRNIIEEDLASGKHTTIATRFPPHPNGYLHIGHAKAICLNFGLAEEYDAPCNLRFDDTNPEKESEEYMQAIQRDIQWLGFQWSEPVKFTSSYFEVLYELAIKLIRKGLAYVCSLTPEQAREYRGTLTQPGRNSPDRDRPIEENLDLFERMRKGEFAEGQYSLRAKIDMASGNINLRDPMMYRIRKIRHHQTGDKWCIYPTYDYSHPISDALEGITHSLCSLEFQDHRPLYNWFVEHCEMTHKPRQIEFSRLNLNYTITSKRYLKKLVDDGLVTGWNDPRMPTISGYRRRGYTPKAIRNFCETIGISKQDSIIDISLLEQAIRDDLDVHVQRRMAVLKPLKVVIENYPQEKTEVISVANHPKDAEMGRRDLTFTREIYIDQDDFMLEPPKDFYRLGPGKSVRLLNGYVIECREVIQDEMGKVIELRCHYLPETLGGKKPADGRKVKGFIHWVSAKTAIDAKVRLYDRLFLAEHPDPEADFKETLNPASLQEVIAKVEPALKDSPAETHFQFNRVGYFCADQFEHDVTSGHLVFNQTVTLKQGY